MSSSNPPQRLIIAGGGLAGCLAAFAVAERRPEVELLLVEAEDRLGGNHIWSFFESDVAPADRWLIEPFVSARWPDHEVRFPAHRRVIRQAYQSIRSEQLDAVVRARLGRDQLRLGTRIRSVEPGAVILDTGERIEGALVDARGAADLEVLELGWQKFVGIEFRFAVPHGVERPLIMDATVDQIDGYRFVYLLPFSEVELLVEDTYYSDAATLDVPSIRQRIADYMDASGLPRGQAVREETGVLPVAIGGDINAMTGGEGPARIGMRGAFFHPTTGYSLPDAVRTAALLARQPTFDGETLRSLFVGETRRLWQRRRFYRTLNKMLFHAAKPDQRYRVLERFYRLRPALIGRFYSGHSSLADKLRILAGKPPVPLGAALGALMRGGTK